MGFLEQVLEYRAYAAAYYAFRANPKAATGEMVDLVKQITFALVQAEMDDDAQK